MRSHPFFLRIDRLSSVLARFYRLTCCDPQQTYIRHVADSDLGGATVYAVPSSPYGRIETHICLDQRAQLCPNSIPRQTYCQVDDLILYLQVPVLGPFDGLDH